MFRWKSSHKLIADNKFTKNFVISLTKSSGVVLRYFVIGYQLFYRHNAPEFLLTIDRTKVPLIIFSAGIGMFISINAFNFR